MVLWRPAIYNFQAGTSRCDVRGRPNAPIQVSTSSTLAPPTCRAIVLAKADPSSFSLLPSVKTTSAFRVPIGVNSRAFAVCFSVAGQHYTSPFFCHSQIMLNVIYIVGFGYFSCCSPPGAGGGRTCDDFLPLFALVYPFIFNFFRAVFFAPPSFNPISTEI
jgi:hypothetical protein